MIRKEALLSLLFVILFYFNLRGQVHVYNLADDFSEYYKLYEDVSDELKVEKFKTEVYNNAPMVYENIYNDIKWIGQKPRGRILLSVNNFVTIENKYSELSRYLDTLFDYSLLSFQKEFTDFKPDFDVYILHSLGIRAGGLVKIQDENVLMFGVDQIAKHFDFQNYTPFFHHELTHIYHSLYYTPIEDGRYSKGALYNHLWREGLAVYISSVLNPDASDKEVFMHDSLPQKTDKVLKIIAQDVIKNLYSTDKELIRKYFWESSTDTVIPKTAGYYLGYILAKEIGNEYSLNELIKLKEDAFVHKFEIILNNICNQ
ncbi:MAG: hypothetical protein JXA06_09045 [Bacteroidetes bacterium]|nr:hypothetical protein [Bacteroidota bacterium]